MRQCTFYTKRNRSQCLSKMSTRVFSRICKMTTVKPGSFLSTAALPQEKKIIVGNYNINYIKVGTGPHNVLCLPGALGTIWTDFKAQIEAFDRNEFTLIVWDAPGYGKSRPPEKDFTFNKYYETDVDYVHQFMKALKLETYSLLGWSSGGITSVIHAAKYPDSLRKLVIWGCNAFILPYELESYKRMKIKSNWSKSSFHTMTAIYGEENYIKYVSNFCDAMIEIYNKRDGNLCLECLPDIKCPTYILHGGHDPVIQKLHALYFNTHISGSRIHIYPEGKHNIHMKYALDFNKRVQEFLVY